jgi:transposase
VSLSEEDAVAEEVEAGAAEHLPFDHLRLAVDAFRSPVVVRERERGGGCLDAGVEAAGEGVQVRQAGGAGIGDGFPPERGGILLRERSPPVGETRRKFDQDFRDGAVRIVREAGKPIARVARELGVNEGTLGNWVTIDRKRREDGDAALDKDERAELTRLRREVGELQMQRDVLKRPVVLWVQEAVGR